MKTLRIVIFIVVAMVQFSVPASVVWKRERTLKHGRVWKFRTAPVDPIDAIRGRYVRLRFAAEEVPAEEPRQQEHRVRRALSSGAGGRCGAVTVTGGTVMVPGGAGAVPGDA